jgi:hypothetical protein
MKNFFRTIAAARASLRVDAEYRELIESHNNTMQKAQMIKDFLLKVTQENLDGAEKFNDEILEDAEGIIDECGPGALYWMADIAAELAKLSQYALADQPTNVSQKFGGQASAIEIIDEVVVVR